MLVVEKKGRPLRGNGFRVYGGRVSAPEKVRGK